MLQQCPQCLTLVQPGKNAETEGDKIRCSHCGYLFRPSPEHRTESGQDTAGNDRTENPLPQLAVEDRLTLYDNTPSLPSRTGTGWILLPCILLVLILPLQIVYFKRNELVILPAWQPYIESMCQSLHCTIQMPRDLNQIRIIGRDVRSHPTIRNALAISIVLNNTATFKQAYPDLRLRFSDMRGRILASRRFSPKEYLPKTVSAAQGMPSNTPVQGNLLIVDPGKEAVNFEFEFF